MSRDETAALGTLVGAADGRASIEATSALALSLLGPWAASRLGPTGRPTADKFNSRVLEFLDRPGIFADPQPVDRGPLGFLAFLRQACPLDAITGPAWIADLPPGCWIALPPCNGYRLPLTTVALGIDGRLAMLAILAQQAREASGPGPEIDAAVRTLTAWCCGPTAADWSTTSSTEARAMRAHEGFRSWWTSFRTVDVDAMAAIVSAPDAVAGADWVRPPLSDEEEAEAEARRRVLAERAEIQDFNARYFASHPSAALL